VASAEVSYEVSALPLAADVQFDRKRNEPPPPSFRRGLSRTPIQEPESRLKKLDPGLRRGDGARKIKLHTSLRILAFQTTDTWHQKPKICPILTNFQILFIILVP
jgi:hypothetical protein